MKLARVKNPMGKLYERYDMFVTGKKIVLVDLVSPKRLLKSGVDGLSRAGGGLTTNIKGRDEKGSQLTAKPAKR